MKKIISSLILLAICFVTLPQALADTPISCSDILKQGLSEGDGEYLVDPDGPSGKDPFLVYCDMTNGGWQLIYNRNNAYFTPDHMVQRYPNDTINFNVNSTSWYIPPDAGLWKWEISVDGGTSWRGITTGIPGTAFANTHNTVINVPVSQVSDNSLSSSGSFYFQTFTLEDQCLFSCDSDSATWWGIVNVSQGAGDQLNPGIGGHSDACDLDNNLVAGDNYTWGDDDLEIYLSDYKNIQGDGIGGTNCIPDGPTDLYRYRFWARTGEAELVYFNDFEGVVGSEWSNPSTDTTPIGARKFLGQFSNDNVGLTLTSLPPHSAILVSFDLFIIESWDGNNNTFGPDFWELSVDGGPALLKTTFSNAFKSETDFRQAYPDSYPGGDNPGLTGAAEFDTLGYPDFSGYAGANDSVYRLIFTVPHSASSLILHFSGSNLEGAAESWGIDNLSVNALPKPDIVNDLVTFEPDPSTFEFTTDTADCQSGAVGKFKFDAKLVNISEKELSNLYVEVDELTNDNLLLTDEGLKGEGDIFKIAAGFKNVALNADVELKGAPFFEGGWGGGKIVSKDTIVDGIFLSRSQQWDQGAVWWDSTDGEDRYIEIDLTDEYIINSLIVQADDNDAYKLYYWDITNNNWQLAWHVPVIGGWGMQTRPNPSDDTEKYFLSDPITTDAFLFRGDMDDSDRLFSVSEIQAFTGVANDYSDGILSPDEYVDVPFCVCLQSKDPFRFFVNVLGSSKINLTNTPWKMHKGAGIVPFGFEAPYHGWEGEYDFASIPAENDAGWGPAPDPKVIDYSISSILCGVMDCREGADFTYFQTILNVPSGVKIKTFSIELDGIDDGVEVKIFNSDNPDGAVASYVFLGESKTIDLKSFIKSGEKNRVVLTHTDDCCSGSYLEFAQLTMVVE